MIPLGSCLAAAPGVAVADADNHNHVKFIYHPDKPLLYLVMPV
jgi:hypothetical protein